jgi:hypothetical protein
MEDKTDPALELSALCESLARLNGAVTTAQAICDLLDVDLNSPEFFQIIAAIHQKFGELQSLFEQYIKNKALRGQAESHLMALKQVFQHDRLQAPLSDNVRNSLTPANIGPIKFLSPTLSEFVSYPVLNDTEIEYLVGELDELMGWLVRHQLTEQDFFRAAIMDGLTQFRFRLMRLRWLGWGYSLQGLKDVIQAYMALEGRINVNDTQNQVSAVMLKKISVFVGSIYFVLHSSKEISETGDFLIKAYEKIISISPVKSSIAGYLTGPMGAN